MIQEKMTQMPAKMFLPATLASAGLDAEYANMLSALAVVYNALRSGRTGLVEAHEFPGHNHEALAAGLADLVERGCVLADGLSARIAPAGVRLFEGYFALAGRDAVYAARREILSQFLRVGSEDDEQEVQASGDDAGLLAVALAGLEADGALRVRDGCPPHPRATLTMDGFCILAARTNSNVKIRARAPNTRIVLSGTGMALLNGLLILIPCYPFRFVDTALIQSLDKESEDVYRFVHRIWHAILDDNSLTNHSEWAASSHPKRAALRVTMDMTPALLETARVAARACLAEFATNWEEFVAVAGGALHRYPATVADLRSLAESLDGAMRSIEKGTP
jgi:hypothetical protein